MGVESQMESFQPDDDADNDSVEDTIHTTIRQLSRVNE